MKSGQEYERQEEEGNIRKSEHSVQMWWFVKRHGVLREQCRKAFFLFLLEKEWNKADSNSVQDTLKKESIEKENRSEINVGGIGCGFEIE